MTKPFRITVVAGLLAAAFSSAGAYDWGSRDRDDNSDCASGSPDGSNRSSSLQAVGLTSDQRLICFNENRPADARTIGSVNGLSTDTKLVGIDFRVQNGKLYGVGNMGGVYILSTSDASATLVNRLSVALSGANFGVDFNPAADRLPSSATTARTCATMSMPAA